MGLLMNSTIDSSSQLYKQKSGQVQASDALTPVSIWKRIRDWVGHTGSLKRVEKKEIIFMTGI
jgi:hypothetical protein